jgi:hypothetical protein
LANFQIFWAPFTQVHHQERKPKATSGAKFANHSGVYSQNCNEYFLIVLLIAQSSVSINLPIEASWSRYDAVGLHQFQVIALSQCNVQPTANCQSSQRLSHIG